jgi:hypothetical protein
MEDADEAEEEGWFGRVNGSFWASSGEISGGRCGEARRDKVTEESTPPDMATTTKTSRYCAEHQLSISLSVLIDRSEWDVQGFAHLCRPSWYPDLQTRPDLDQRLDLHPD